MKTQQQPEQRLEQPPLSRGRPLIRAGMEWEGGREGGRGGGRGKEAGGHDGMQMRR